MLVNVFLSAENVCAPDYDSGGKYRQHARFCSVNAQRTDSVLDLLLSRRKYTKESYALIKRGSERISAVIFSSVALF